MDAIEYNVLLQYLSNKSYPSGYSKDQKRRLREKCESFFASDATLYHNGCKGKQQKVIKKEDVKDIIQHMHASEVGGSHFGINATQVKIAQRFWWPKMTEDIRHAIRTCEKCCRANPKTHAEQAQLHPVKVPPELFHRWGIDMVGPLKTTERGNTYIITATEYLTKWCEIEAVPDKSADRVHSFLMKLFYRFGACSVLLHDQGREFNNSKVNDLCETLNVQVAMTSAYHPQTNGLTERFNQTLVTSLCKVVNEQADDWDIHLDAVAFAYRTKQQASTKMSPFQLMYGVQARLPVDLQDQSTTDVGDEDAETFAKAVTTRAKTATDLLRKTRDEAVKNIENAQATQKKQYDIKRRPATFDLGDRVLRYNRRRETRKGGKLNVRYDGPFLISEVLGKGVYRLTTTSGSPVKTMANSRDLKLFPTEGYASPSKLSSSAKRLASTISQTECTSPTRKLCRRALESSSNSNDTDNMWLPTYHLTIQDRQLVRNGWLNDRIIDAVNKLVSTKLVNADVDTTQTTLLAQSASGFSACVSETVMILHAENHWITVASTVEGVKYVDSLRPHQPLSPYVIRQLLQLFPHHIREDGKLRISILPSTPQTNASDCGVYAAAYATELVVGNITGIQAAFQVTSMREHLEKCLEAEQLTPFPRDPTKSRGRRRKVINVDVHADGVELI